MNSKVKALCKAVTSTVSRSKISTVSKKVAEKARSLGSATEAAVERWKSASHRRGSFVSGSGRTSRIQKRNANNTMKSTECAVAYPSSRCSKPIGRRAFEGSTLNRGLVRLPDSSTVMKYDAVEFRNFILGALGDAATEETVNFFTSRNITGATFLTGGLEAYEIWYPLFELLGPEVEDMIFNIWMSLTSPPRWEYVFENGIVDPGRIF